MSQLTQVLNAAWQDLSEQFYSDRYLRWMGKSWTKPGLNIDIVEYPILESDSPLLRLDPVIRIGYYSHAPFFSNDNGYPEGFEYDLMEEMIRILKEHYGDQINGELEAQWISVPVDEDTLGDGRDNATIATELDAGLTSTPQKIMYDMVFSGIFNKGTGEGRESTDENPVFEAAHPNMRFWVGPIYTFKDGIENIPTGDMTAIAKTFKDAGVSKVIITHTPSGQQIDAGLTMASFFMNEGVFVELRPQLVKDIIVDINNRDDDGNFVEPNVHFYVGDLIQVQRMSLEKTGVDVEVNILELNGMNDMTLAPYTLK